LRQLFSDYKIEESNLEFSVIDAPLSYKGALYPLRNGFVQAADMDENLLTASITSIEGRKEMVDAIAEFENNISTIHGILQSPWKPLKAGMTKREAGL
jgi:hypothetical protein